MKIGRAFAISAILSLSCSFGASAEGTNCDVGPLSRPVGGNDRLVYGCNNNASLIFVSTPQSPAHPFYFLLFYEAGKVRLVGEGAGSQIATKSAYDELIKLSDQDWRALIQETHAVSASQPSD